MKLFTTFNRINLLAIIFIFLLASISFYFLINIVVTHQIDDDLRIKQKEVRAYVNFHHHLPEFMSVRDQVISYRMVSVPELQSFKSLILYDTLEQESNLFRQLTFTISAGGNLYEVKVSKSLEDIGSIVHTIFLISVVTILLILISSYLINRIVLKKLWRPFYESMELMRSFKLQTEETFHFKSTKIDEFNFMNDILSKATKQARQDYIILKEFTENASHEMQTPLAVIRSKLDILIQDENITENQSSTLQSTYNAITKLSRLNQSLLLLTKIENRQFENIHTINIKSKLEEKTAEFKELWASHEIEIDLLLSPTYIQMNNELADILLNNLLSNATRHNYKKGEIKIELAGKYLLVSNTSKEGELNKSLLFSRFYKPNPGSGYNGLGLSIIKQICDAAGLKISYMYSDNLHQFKILF